ncbi:MAG: Asp-tRNA(Asn)/Glu-tRNA(Gln) amidotransferase subunit GatB [Oligoflexia bacterium]|nr:Asp-tRNA(Asn)/Glu-tRNA(Gln) amidotransferase subunit GatB [Oligoflexia bacterium]
MNYEAVIGLEVHTQLATRSKLFCSCSNEFGSVQNANICPVCSAQPGVLPVLNARAVRYAVKAALALNCKINPTSIFARKSYFYPDLPKGFQTSQYDRPFSSGGYIDISLPDGTLERIGLTRIHMEEDAGKNIHEGSGSLVDLNRAGAPLIEIVSEPDLRSPEQAVEYLKKLKAILTYIEVSDCNMEQGNFRCDANVSVRKTGEKKLGTKVEIKNMNSFRFIEKALSYEIERQSALLAAGTPIVQETRLFDSDSGTTRSMRRKEEANDYRYFPEPDLQPLIIDERMINELKSEIPELPDAKIERFIGEYSIPRYDAEVIATDKSLAVFYEKLVSVTNDPKLSSNWIMMEVMRVLNDQKISIDDFSVDYRRLGELLLLVIKKEINQQTAKDIFNEMLGSPVRPSEIVDRDSLRQIQDHSFIEKIVDDVLARSQDQVAQFKSGKDKVMGYFVGQVMRQSRGKADPAVVNAILLKKLKE